MRLALLTMIAIPCTALAEPPALPQGLTARVAYLVDDSSGAVLFARDAARRMPPASMTKIMTAMVAFDAVAAGEIKLDDRYAVRPETWQRWHGPAAGSTMFLSPNEKVRVRDLLHGIVTLSGNDACIVLAEGLAGSEAKFVERMNATARRLGLANTQYGTPNGWPDGGRTFTTAEDLVKLSHALIAKHPALYREFFGQPSFSWGKTGGGAAITQPNRNPLLGRVAGADGVKTGHTAEAGYGFTGSAVQNGRRLLMVVAGLESEAERIRQSVALMNWGFSSWSTVPFAPKGKQVGSVPVQMGGRPSVAVVAPQGISVTVPAGAAPQWSARIVFQGPVRAPIAIGQPVARLVLSAPGLPDQNTELVAAEAVGRAGLLGRVWSGLLSLFSA